jgi:hypothetical protein
LIDEVYNPPLDMPGSTMMQQPSDFAGQRKMWAAPPTCGPVWNQLGKHDEQIFQLQLLGKG